MNERLKRIIFKKLDQDLGQAEIIVDDNKSIWFIDRANKFWYLELRSSGTLWWRYSFFRDFFPLFGLERLEYEPVIAEWVEEVLKRGVSSTTERRFGRMEPVEEVLKRGVSSTLRAFGHFGVEEVLKREVSSTEFNDGVQSVGAEKVLKREVFSTLQSKIDYQNQVEEVLKREVSSTLHREFPLMDGGVEEALKRGVSSTQRNHMNDCDEMEEALKRGVYSTQCNVGLQGSRPVEEVLKPKASPTTADKLSTVVTMEEALKLGVSSFLNFDTPRNREVGRALNNKVSSSNSKELLQYEVDKVLQIKIQPEETNVKRVLSLKAGVRECKMKIKKIFKKFTSK
jgi:hypothetical protein